MAVARPQPRGATFGLQIWLIVAFVVALIFAVLFIVQYIDQAQLVEDRNKAEQNLAKVISSNEQTTLSRFTPPPDSRKTMVGQMNEEIEGLAKVATGANTPEESNLTVVRQKVDTLLKAVQATEGLPDPNDFQGANLFDTAGKLHQLYVESLKANAALTAKRNELAAQNEQLTSQLQAAKEAFVTGGKQMQEKVTAIETERGAWRKEKDAAVSAFQQQVAQVREAKDDSERKLKNRIAEVSQAVESRDKAITVLKDKIDQLVGPAADAESIASEPDGEIIQAEPADSLVYINLGKKKHLTLGINFAVFSPPVPGQPREKPKATIEVVGIFENTAECRVISVKEDNPIVEGDLIANAVYDPRRAMRFVVAGQFDLDNDNRTDLDGQERVAALIRQWGGQVVEALDERVDFVVIGTKPPVYRIADDATPEQQERHKEQKGKEDEFLALKSEAKALSIPMLTQAQFLRFLGAGGGQVAGAGNGQAAADL